MGLIVQKFGGTSVSDARKIHRAAHRAIRTRLEGHRVVMVVSAMGTTTDNLLALARQVTSAPPARELDMLLSTGEQVSIALTAMAIHAAGRRAISLTAAQLGLVTDSAHTQARIRRIEWQRLERELDAGKIVIVAGFQGVDTDGEITTLGRGASDTTATALAAVLGADVCEIYTDVGGVYTADPRRVPQARKIDVISYDEMLEMASSGAAVVHGRAIELATRFNLPIQVRSSQTDAPGTMIVAENEVLEDIAVRGVTLREDLAMITLIGVPNIPGLAATIFETLSEKNIILHDIIQNLAAHGERVNLGFVVTATDAPMAKEIAERLSRKHRFEGVALRSEVSKVSAVGTGMRSHPGVAATMFRAIGNADINIHAVSTSDIVVSCIVARSDGPRALAALHDAFELSAAHGERPPG